MNRLHIFEWEDQAWLPELFRHFITDHLVFQVSRLFAPVVPKLTQALQQSGHTHIVDLCSGSGGPLLALLPQCARVLGYPVTATLSDLYPNRQAFERAKALSKGQVNYCSTPTSAMSCPQTLQGMRTLFMAFHHFRPQDAKKILQDAADQGMPIGIFEIQERSLSKLLLIPLIALLSAFVLTPRVGRLTWRRFLFTYVLPLAPFFYTWDSLVSCLRTYSPAELRALSQHIAPSTYQWEAGLIPSNTPLSTFHITYLLGMPVPPTVSGPDA